MICAKNIQPKQTACHTASHHCVKCHDSKIIEKEHKEHDCNDKSCNIEKPHGHINPDHNHDNCFSCMKEHLRKIFPLERYINSEVKHPVVKQLLFMVSNLTPAVGASEMAHSIHLSPFFASPLAISAMHLTNRGLMHTKKLLLTSLSSVGIIALQKFVNLPRALIRPIMALAVFFIERNGNHTKDDVIKLLKLQGQINTIPLATNFLIGKLKENIGEGSNSLDRFFNHVGHSVLRVLGLSIGFVGMGHLIDELLCKLKFVTNEESLSMKTEGAVCACCGAPVCVAESASEVGSMHVAA